MNQPSYALPHFPAAPLDPPRAPWTAARFAVAGLAAGALFQILTRIIEAATLTRHIDALRAGDGSRLEPVDLALALGTLLNLLLLLFAGVSFIVWAFLTHRNCERIGVYPERARGWTIAAWFIPIANLVLPWRVIVDIREVSTPLGPDGRPEQRPHPPVGWWWVTYLLMTLLGIPASMAHAAFTLPGASLEAAVSNRPVILGFGVATMVLAVPAAVLGALVVLRITAAQERSAALKLGAAQTPSDPAPV